MSVWPSRCRRWGVTPRTCLLSAGESKALARASRRDTVLTMGQGGDGHPQAPKEAESQQDPTGPTLQGRSQFWGPEEERFWPSSWDRDK